MDNKQLIAYLQSILDWNSVMPNYYNDGVPPSEQQKKEYHGQGIANGIKALIALLEAGK